MRVITGEARGRRLMALEGAMLDLLQTESKRDFLI